MPGHMPVSKRLERARALRAELPKGQFGSKEISSFEREGRL